MSGAVMLYEVLRGDIGVRTIAGDRVFDRIAERGTDPYVVFQRTSVLPEYTLGGEVIAPTHYDLLMWDPTIEIDGRVVQRGTEILV